VIVSHRHEFIFVKTTKTAGSSTELFLRQFCGPDDIITAMSQRDEQLARSLGAAEPRHDGPHKMRPWELRRSDLRRGFRRREWPNSRRYHQHMSARDALSAVGDEVWSRYRRVTIVRNPWDAVVSRYFWRAEARALDPIAALDDAVERATTNWSIYTIDDEVAVDTVLRYEHLTEDLDQLVADLGLSPRYPLPRAKAGIRPPHTPAHEILSAAQARRVAELAHREIETFGYTWPGPDPI